MRTIQSSLRMLGLGALALSLTFQASAAEAPPERMTYQGFLVDGNGVALGTNAPTNYEVIFRIYSEQTGGDLKWSEQQTVTVDKGYFSVLLGEGADVGSEDRPALSEVFRGADASSRYLGITVKGIGIAPVGSDADILPRLQLVTSPYAFLATGVPDGAISSASLLDESVSGQDIQNGSLRSEDIADGSIQSQDIQDGTIRGADIANATIENVDIKPGTITGYEMRTGTITSREVADNSITSTDIQNSSITGSDLRLEAGLRVSDYRTSGSANDCIAAWSYDTNRMLFHGVAREGGTWKTRFWVNPAGNGFLRYAWTHTSDERLKEDIAPLRDALEGALQLKPSVFRMKDDPGHGQDIGLIAQDVLPVYPELVTTNRLDGTLGVNYSAFGVIAVAAIQELHGTVEVLESENAELRARLTAIETRLQALAAGR